MKKAATSPGVGPDATEKHHNCTVSRMAEAYKPAGERGHNRDAEDRNRQRWNPEQKYSQEFIFEFTGRK